MTDTAHILELARAAGRAILSVYEEGDTISVEKKGDDSPLTLADRRAHEVIAAGLATLSPDIPVVSEEGEERAGGVRYWLVDPLDGTKEFIKRTGEFTVNIALVEHGVPVVGVVHAPVLGTSWVGDANGALRHTAAGDVEPIAVLTPAASSSLRLVASRDHAGPLVGALLARLPGATTLSMGSSLKFCLVAEGRADLYFRDGPTMPWDTAAAHAVLRAAGGEVFTVDGLPLAYHDPQTLNPHFVAVGDLSLPWRTLLFPQTPQ